LLVDLTDLGVLELPQSLVLGPLAGPKTEPLLRVHPPQLPGPPQVVRLGGELSHEGQRRRAGVDGEGQVVRDVLPVFHEGMGQDLIKGKSFGWIEFE